MSAFNFGTPGAAASTPAFGAASTTAFGASSAPAFGAASAPALGSTPSFAFGVGSAAASSSSLFGSTTTPSLFSQPAASTPAPFGAASAAAFGASSTPSLFGAASTSAFGAAASTPSLFGAASSPAPSSFAFGSAAQQGTSLVPGATQPAQPQPLTANAKFEDLAPGIQKELTDIEQEISKYRQDCALLDQDIRLQDNTALKQNIKDETKSLQSALEGLINTIKADDEALVDFREKVIQLLRCTETAVRTFQRAKLWREAPQQYKGQLIPPQVQELLSAPVVLPNPYLELAIQGFTDALDSYRQVVCELEAALPPHMQAYAAAGGSGDLNMATALPTIISHMHDYFVHVAAELEQLHNQVERAKASFLAQRQAAGDMTNPFADSRRHQLLAAARPVVLPPSTHHGSPHHHMAQGHGAGHSLHAGTAHGPGGVPTPGAFGTPLSPNMGGAAPFGTPAVGAGADSSQKQSKGRRKG